MKAQAIVARNIRGLRVERGLSQEALAAEAAIDRSYLGRLEREQENPTVGLLEKIAGVLKVELVELLRAPEPGQKRPSRLPAGRKKRPSPG